jgi:hypothetical protein
VEEDAPKADAAPGAEETKPEAEEADETKPDAAAPTAEGAAS